MVSKTFKIALLLLTMFSAPAIAHNVELAGDVAGTWHVEPDENPKAGESAKVWIALTRKGGEVLPLEQANCKLAVYPQPHTEGDRPILQPQLKAIAVEKYQGIPGADLVFPKPGLYEMELSCTPKREGDFTAFEMQSEATVGAETGQGSPMPTVGQSPANPMDAEHSDHAKGSVQTSNNSAWQRIIISGVLPLILVVGLVIFLFNRSRKS
jgi:hypothetical protein